MLDCQVKVAVFGDLWRSRAKHQPISVSPRAPLGSPTHGFNDGRGREVVEVSGGGGDAAMAELAGDDGDVDALGAELGGVGVAESVGVDALVDTGPGAETFEHDPDVSVSHPVTLERAEYPGGGR